MKIKKEIYPEHIAVKKCMRIVFCFEHIVAWIDFFLIFYIVYFDLVSVYKSYRCKEV